MFTEMQFQYSPAAIAIITKLCFQPPNYDDYLTPVWWVLQHPTSLLVTSDIQTFTSVRFWQSRQQEGILTWKRWTEKWRSNRQLCPPGPSSPPRPILRHAPSPAAYSLLFLLPLNPPWKVKNRNLLDTRTHRKQGQRKENQTLYWQKVILRRVGRKKHSSGKR